MRTELINVIVAGFPLPLASKVARACSKRNFGVSQLALGTRDFKGDSVEVPDVGKLNIISLANTSDARNKLAAEVSRIKDEDDFPIVADVSNDSANIDLYNECDVAFVMRTMNQEARAKSKKLSVISDEFNKQLVAFDSIMREYGRRFPGLFRGFDLVSDGTKASRQLVHSLNDLFVLQ